MNFDKYLITIKVKIQSTSIPPPTIPPEPYILIYALSIQPVTTPDLFSTL